LATSFCLFEHMMHFVYILYSPSLDKYYIVETQNLEERLAQHRSHSFKSSFTMIASDWWIARSANLFSRIRARKMEAFLKRQKSKDLI